MSVHARPAPLSPSTSTHQSVVTQTAKKIMDALNSISSPLTDARKLPMRGLHPEVQVCLMVCLVQIYLLTVHVHQCYVTQVGVFLLVALVRGHLVHMTVCILG